MNSSHQDQLTNTTPADNKKALGREAISRAKKHIKESSTLYGLSIDQVREIDTKIKMADHRVPDLAECVSLILSYPNNPTWRRIEIRLRTAKLFNVGNCQDLSELVVRFLRKKNIKRIEMLSIRKNDHVIAAFDREGDINDYTTWGENSTFIDALNDEVFYGSEIYSKLKKYVFDETKEYPNILSPFTKQNKLKVEICIEHRVSPEENKTKLTDYLNKIRIIQTASEKYLCDAERIEFHKLLQHIKSPDDAALNQLSNFDLERQLAKNFKKICQFINQLSNQNASKMILTEIGLNIVNTYSSYEMYFRNIRQLDVLFITVIEKIIKNESELSQHLTRFLFTSSTLKKYLAWAIKDKKCDVIYTLIANGANPRIDDEKWTALHIAAKKRRVDLIKLILTKDNSTIDLTVDCGMTALHFATKKNSLECVETLLSFGANPNAHNGDGNTPMMLAIECNNDQLVKLLLHANNFDPNILNEDENSILQLAAQFGFTNIVKLLLSNAEIYHNIDKQNKDGWTALYFAVKHGRVDIVKLLLDSGAGSHIADNAGKTPMMLATETYNRTIFDLLLANQAKYHWPASFPIIPIARRVGSHHFFHPPQLDLRTQYPMDIDTEKNTNSL